MRLMNLILVITLLVIGCDSVDTQQAYIADYKLRFDRTLDGDSVWVGNGHFDVSFVVKSNAPDSLVMQFGMKSFSFTDYESDSTICLYISGDNMRKYFILDSTKQIAFVRQNSRLPMHVRLSYDFMNFSAALMYGKPLDPHNPIADIWETSSGEFYYPFIPNAYMDVVAEFVASDSVEVLAAYPVCQQGDSYICESKIFSHSLQFIYLHKKRYVVDSIYMPYAVPVYQLKSRLLTEIEKSKMGQVLQAGCSFFESVYGESYISEKHGVLPLNAIVFEPSFWGLRYNVNFLTSPIDSNFYSSIGLVHEIGHRWLGEYNLLNDAGIPGAMFLHESLNVFMRMMFGRATGLYDWQRELQKRRKSYAEIKGSNRDRALIDMRYNNNYDVVYNKGPLILDEFAQRIGYDEMVRIVAEFYRRYDLKPGLRYEDFIATVADLHPEIANELDQRLRSI